jgi:uncharacterized membrane protein
VNPEFYERLDLRVRDLENVVHGLRAELDAARAPATIAEPVREPVAAVTGTPESGPAWPTYEQMFGQPPPGTPAAAVPGIPVAAAAPARPGLSLEALLAGRGLQLVGLLLVLLGAGFFLNVAIARGWLGPAEQILLALGVGSALIVYAARRIGPDLTFLAEGLIGLGAAIDYLGLLASVSVFPQLHVSRPLAFAGMVAVTAVLALLASRRRSERIALMGLIGGFLTPLLLDNGLPDHALLAAYLLVLTATMLALGVRSSFRSVEVLTFVAVACYSPAFALDPPRHWNDVAIATVGTLFFATFALAFTLAALSDGKVTATRLTLLVLDTIGYAFVLELTFSERQSVLGWTLLVLAAVLLATARVPALPRRLASAYLYLGVAAATLALPALLHAYSLLDVVTVEAALLVVIGARGDDRWLMVVGALLFALSGLMLVALAWSEPHQHAVLNSLVLAFAIYAAALALALARLAASSVAENAQVGWRRLGTIVLHGVTLTGVSREIVDVLGGPRGLDGLSNEGQFGLSAAWTLYATGLFAAGMARHRALLRWLGLILFGCTVFKVFIVDLASLDVTWRILSFIGLGAVLVGVSAWYQRTMVRQKPGDAGAQPSA